MLVIHTYIATIHNYMLFSWFTLSLNALITFILSNLHIEHYFTYVVFPDPLGPIMAFIPGLIMALKMK